MATLLTDAEAAFLGPGKYRVSGAKGPYLKKSSYGAGFFYLQYSDGDTLSVCFNKRGHHGS